MSLAAHCGGDRLAWLPISNGMGIASFLLIEGRNKGGRRRRAGCRAQCQPVGNDLDAPRIGDRDVEVHVI